MSYISNIKDIHWDIGEKRTAVIRPLTEQRECSRAIDIPCIWNHCSFWTKAHCWTYNCWTYKRWFVFEDKIAPSLTIAELHFEKW